MPHTPIRHISRDRLYRILTKGLQCKLTRVTSPPGFGKTTMVSEWVRQHHINACWVSLDTGDNDVLRFWRYVFQLAMGDMKAVDQWMKSCSFEKETVHNNQEFELLTYMLVLLTKEKTEEAYSLGKLLVKSSQQSGRVMTELEAHLYLSEIYRKKDDLLKSAIHLHQALILGERHGFLRIFSDVGLPIKLLFQQYVDMRKKRQHMPLLKGVSPQYLSNILLSIGYKHAADTKNNSHHTAHDLTKREMEVLHLLAIGLTNKEIATKLVLSEGTVKIHLNRIYSKLETKGRLKAIQKAKKLRLLFGSDE